MKINQNRWLLRLVSVGVLLAASAAVASPAWAERLTSDSYVITFGNFNTTSGEKESATYNVTDTVGQTFAGPFGQYGSSTYFVGAGFQYIYQIGTFGFSLSRTAIDLGELTPGVHNTASHNVTISTKGAGGYTIYAYELHPLRHSNGTSTIEDTTCNTGGCTQAIAGVWTNQDIAGFGFNVSGADAAADFLDNTYFRQFANQEGAEAMQVILSSSNVVKNRQATVTYKAGSSGDHAGGNYQTGVVYVAVPGY